MRNKILKIFSLRRLIFFFIAAEMFNLSVVANPGDTTWVTIFNLRKITQHGNYDTTAVFPTNKRYRKIRLHYILGRYNCIPAPSPFYCGSWDYTTQVFARPAGKDTAEIARVITPYATDWLQLNKKHDYVIEVTDYASLLEGTTSMRYRYDGYSWGFTITLKVEFIEGVPPMDAIAVKKVYNGYFPYGNTNNSIENYLVPKTSSYTSPVSKVFLKNSISGHGSDGAGCAEFCSRYYDLKINNNFVTQKQLWRTDCGVNQVYPQTGTWVFNRGNWCPGAVVLPIYHDLTALTSPATTFSVDIDMEPHAILNPSAGYNFESHLVNYSAPNHTRDVSIEDIISPTKDENYYRNNPACSNPVIRIKNVGTDTLTSVVFNYGLKGGGILTFTWTGSLAFLESTDVVFDPATNILTVPNSLTFEVTAVKINGITGDDNMFNNIYSSKTTPVSVYPKDFVIKTGTNGSTDVNTGMNETTWTLYDENGLVVASRNSLNNTTFYSDTVHLFSGCYKMVVDDGGCDGFQWWYYQYYTPNPGNGSMRFDYINANNTHYTFPGDFGCSFTKWFLVEANYVGVNEGTVRSNIIEVFPNPATNSAQIRLDLNQTQTVNYKILDLTGKIVAHKTLSDVSATYETLDISELSNGVYMVSITLEDNSTVTKKLVIQK